MSGVSTISLGFQCDEPVGTISLGFICGDTPAALHAPGNHVRFFDQARVEDDDILIMITAFMEMLDD